MLVREIMTAPAYCVAADADIDDALKLIAEQRVPGVPVVDDQHHVIGVVCGYDFMKRAVEHDQRTHESPVAEGAPLPTTVREFMRDTPATTTEGEDVADLIEQLAETGFQTVSVVRDDVLVGVVTSGDILAALYRNDAELRDDLVSELYDAGHTGWSVSVVHAVAELRGRASAADAASASEIAHRVVGVRRVHIVTED